MIRSRWIRTGLAWAAFATLGVSAAQAQDPGTGQKVGEKLDEAGAAVRRGVGRASDTVKEQFGRAKASINAMGIESRVYGRIHWDKALEQATLDVSVAKDGTVTLTGTVASAAAKAIAVKLATETVGVTRVIDELTTPAPSAAP